jgi:hypothetical protein
MKKTIIPISAVCLVAFFVRAFTTHALSPNPPKPSMPEAYSFAVQALGAETNHFYCVASKTDSQIFPPTGAWVFTFDANALTHKIVYVALDPFYVNRGSNRTFTQVIDVDLLTNKTNSSPIQ